MTAAIGGGFPFLDDTNAPKFRSLFLPALQKVQRQVHANLSNEDDALMYVEELMYIILGSLCANQPRNTTDMEERVWKTFPHPVDQWAVKEAQRALENHKKKQVLVFPADKLHSLLQKEVWGYKVDEKVSMYVTAVLEYMSADILKLAGNYVRNSRRNVITKQDIKVAMNADKVLLDMFEHDTGPIKDESYIADRASMTYEELVKDVLLEESQYLRDINMITHVFRKSFLDGGSEFCREDIDLVFGNIDEIQELTVTLLNSLEDAQEMCDEGNEEGDEEEEETAKHHPPIGVCFEDLALDSEFDVYELYADNFSNVQSSLDRILSDDRMVTHFRETGPCSGFLEAVRYVLPKLLLVPISHCFYYFDTLKLLRRLSPDEEDQKSLDEAFTALLPLESCLERTCLGFMSKKRDEAIRFQRRPVSRSSVTKLSDLQKSIDQWEGGDIATTCSQLLMEGDLHKYLGKRRTTERHVFLLDGLLLCCKAQPLTRRSQAAEFRLKERCSVCRLEVFDREDSDDGRFAIDVADAQKRMTLLCKTQVEKNDWMAALVVLHIRSALDRTLDALLREEELAVPLQLPDCSQYSFAAPDTDSNLIFEDNVHDRGGAPVIKGGVLHKLVERLTYHKYADPAFVRTFLTTYRSFVKPQEFLTLLIERYSIPNPVDTPEQIEAANRGEVLVREDLKRFKREYAQPVQLRVLNVMRHWVENHFYDFERDKALEERLIEFLDGVRGKSMRKWVGSLMRAIHRQRDSESEAKSKSLIFATPPPSIEWHLTQNPDDFNLITLHPVELARQLTVIESEMFRAVKPSELVGGAWTKEEEKEKNSPNLLRLIKFTTKMTYWYIILIIETECFEERVSVLSRIVDIMAVLLDLNNFNGIVSITSAFHSASVHRLEHTFAQLKPGRRQVLDECMELMANRKQKCKEKLHSINPPCVPFAGIYLTDILYIGEGNKDRLTVEGANEDPIINFSKRRMVAQVIGEIQQYQNQPYCLDVQPDINKFLLNLDPVHGWTEKELQEHLFTKSKEIEPKGKPPTRYPAKWKWDMKPPPKNRHQSVSTLPSRSQVQTMQLPSRSEMPVGQRRTVSSSTSPPSRSPVSTPPPLSAPPLSPLSVTGSSFSLPNVPPPSIPPRIHPRQSSSESVFSSSAPTSGYYGSPLSDSLNLNSPPLIPPRSPRRLKGFQDLNAPVIPPRRPESQAPQIPPRGTKDRSLSFNYSVAPDLPPRKNKP